MQNENTSMKPQDPKFVIEQMGKTYLCHPANQVKRKKPFRKSAKQLRAGLGDGGR